MYFIVEKYKRAGKRPPVFAKTAQCKSTVNLQVRQRDRSLSYFHPPFQLNYENNINIIKSLSRHYLSIIKSLKRHYLSI